MTLKINGYEEHVPNRIFKRNAREGDGGKGIEIIVPFKFTALSQEKTVDSVVELFRSISTRKRTDLNGAELRIIDLPGGAFRKIVERNEEEIWHLRNHAGEERFVGGASYLFVPGGYIKKKNLKKCKSFDSVTNAVNKEPYYNWTIVIRLDEGSMPKREDIAFLLSKGVRSSDWLEIGDFRGRYSKMAEITRLMIDTFSVPEALEQIVDRTKERAEFTVKNLVNEYTECVTTRQVEHHLKDGTLVYRELPGGISVLTPPPMPKKPSQN